MTGRMLVERVAEWRGIRSQVGNGRSWQIQRNLNDVGRVFADCRKREKIQTLWFPRLR